VFKAAVFKHEAAVFKHEGISTRQHNEPAGDRDVWHRHVHVFARQHGDERDRRRSAEPVAR
jgi:histidine triad (HIT) family protein